MVILNKIKNIINILIIKIKNYHPPKYLSFLYFIIPMIILATYNVYNENDLWFLLNHGRYVLEHGSVPLIEPFTIHQNMSFVMQQYLYSTVLYIFYKYLNKAGLVLLNQIINVIIIYFLYKLCMILTKHKYNLSVLITCLTDFALVVKYLKLRPQSITIICLLIVLYVMERLYRENSSKSLLILPLVSILQINFHASMYFMLYVFMLPYIVALFVDFIKDKKDKRLFKLLLIIPISIACALLNPYGLSAITYVFKSYGVSIIDEMVSEMQPFSPAKLNFPIVYLYVIVIILIYIFNKDGKKSLPHFFLFVGTAYLMLKNTRNVPLFIIGSLPFVSYNIRDYFQKNENKFIIPKGNKLPYIFIIISLIGLGAFVGYYNNSKLIYRLYKENVLENFIEYMDENNISKDAKIYTNYNIGGYLEFYGYHVYLDPRAEVFLKSNNNQSNILSEYNDLMCGNSINYVEFIQKYDFDYLLVHKNELIYINYLSKNKDYEILYSNSTYVLLKRPDKRACNLIA